MLKLSKRVGYGLIALKHLALYGGQGSASAKLISVRYRIPSPLLSKILQRLTREGFLVSECGAAGGYRLARDPRQISTLEVICAIDGPIKLTSCSTNRGDCEQLERCTVRAPLQKVREGIVDLLAKISIMDLSEDEVTAAAADGDLLEVSGTLHELTEASSPPRPPPQSGEMTARSVAAASRGPRMRVGPGID